MPSLVEWIDRGMRRWINPTSLKSMLAGGRSGYVLSAGLHVAAGALLAVFALPRMAEMRASAVDLSYADEQPAQTFDAAPLAIGGDSTNPGGSLSGDPQASPEARSVVNRFPEAQVADAGTHSYFDLDPGLPPADELAQSVLGPKIAKALGRGRGGGVGDGIGSGSGAGRGLFDTEGGANRFVYVLDCSASMKEQDSQERNRFERLKLELVRSIANLSESQEFFVVFFNSAAVPMPARSLQLATLHNKRKYLEWVVKIQGGGETDPTEALSLAFRLDPDLIYLLTDGSFDEQVSESIAVENTRRVAIHTYCLGDAKGEALLKRIADDNRGVYTFVP